MEAVCPVCLNEIGGNSVCCEVEFNLLDGEINYDFEKLLFRNFKRDYFLNKELNNNGIISYMFLSSGSISLSSREDVKAFNRYIKHNYNPGHILDIGCGPMEIPGYLTDIDRVPTNTIIGLEPDKNTKFKFIRIIGCAEYVPLASKTIDTIIFATSLDHVCNLEKSIKEAGRLLKPGGKIIIWHHYPTRSKFKLIKDKIINFIHYGYNTFRYAYYRDENIVLHIPRGAVDPFHKEYIKPSKIIKIMKKNNFYINDASPYTNGSIFISFTKNS